MPEAKKETGREIYPLDDALIDTIAQGQKQINDINVSIQAVLGYFLKQHGLKGNWRVAENMKELVLEAPAPPQN